jgi:hypothetical protein
MNDPIYIGAVEYPDDGIRVHEDGTFWYHPEFDVNGVHQALLDPSSGYGKAPR